MTTYFGYQTTTGGSVIIGPYNGYTYGSKISSYGANEFVCPGSGAQNITSIEAYCFQDLAGGVLRLSVYLLGTPTGESLKGETASFQPNQNGDVPYWAGAAVTQYGTLTGGLSYVLAMTAATQDGSVYGVVGSGGDSGYQANDYTAGFPATLALGSANTTRWAIRCGVDAASSIEQEGFRFRNDDGSESAATWKANQDVNITAAADTAMRLRMLLNATGDPASIGAQLEYRYKPSGGAFGAWGKVLVP